MKRYMSSLLSLLVVLGLVLSSSPVLPVAAQSSEPEGSVSLKIEADKLTWLVTLPYDRAELILTAPDGSQVTRSFEAGQPIEVGFGEVLFSEGGYTYELHLLPVIDPFLKTQMRLVADNAELREEMVAALEESGALPEESIATGAFAVQGGVFTAPVTEGDNQIQDVLHYDDVVITGSLCVGFDCIDGENFGFDTIILKENNLRIFFNDTSTTAGFPANDWTLIANDSASGGMNYFAIQDRTNNKVPFMIEAGAPNYSLYIEDYGRVGLGTNTPVVELHIKDSDTPTVRLEQDGSGGWTPQTWDVAGNESNFFIRDVTGGSKLPFRIQPGTPTNTLTMKNDGKVGIGTWTPAETLHVVGNIRADGYVIEYSDVNAKENFAAVDGAALLDKIAALPILSWNYKAEDDGVRHIGPMAQDFFAAFGLGADNKHIAALDTNGISLAAIQELIKLNKSQQAQINELQKQNAELEARIERLEKALLP